MVDLPEQYNTTVLLDRNLEAGRASKVAIYHQDERVTYGELYERVCRLGRALRRLGVRREERVLLVLDDTPAFPTVFMGAMRIGAVAVPVNPLYKMADYRYFVEDSYARVVIVDAPFLEKITRALVGYPEPVTIVVANGRGEGVLALDDVLAAEEGDLSPADTHQDDLAFWLYSSGSTGKPKGVVHLHHDIAYTCESYARHVLQIGEADLTFSTGKLFHAYGLGNNISFPYWVGASTILRSGRPTPQGVLETIQRFRPSLFFSVPTLYNLILNDPEASRYDLSSIRACVSAAEPLPAETWRRWHDTFGHVILDGIGSTEVLHIYCSNTLDAYKPGSSGKPVPGYSLKILDDEGRSVPPGTSGELYVSGDSSAAYYWHRHQKTKSSMRGEWFVSGDRYHADADGFFWCEGRSDDMIRVSGEWVSPIDLENTLLQHSAVLEAAVVGVSVAGITRIKAAVILKSGCARSPELVQELQTWCKDRLERYQYPHLVDFVDELPKTMTGKIQRFLLREAT